MKKVLVLTSGGDSSGMNVFLKSFAKLFKKENIYENKANDQMSDIESAEFEEEEVIRIAHLPDDKEV